MPIDPQDTTSLFKTLSSSLYPIGSPQLEAAYNLPGVTLREHISILRKAGVPICSGADGYWMASSKQDLVQNLHHLYARGMDMIDTWSKCLAGNWFDTTGVTL